jgi:hypothetical protein
MLELILVHRQLKDVDAQNDNGTKNCHSIASSGLMVYDTDLKAFIITTPSIGWLWLVLTG